MKKTIKIDGMGCEHCIKSVKEAFIKGIFEGDANFGKNGIMLQLATKKGLMNLKMLMGSVGLYPSFSFSGKIKGNNYWLLILSGSQCEKLFNLDRKTEEYKTILAVCTGSINLNW